jgi:hypothetical protein
MAAVPRARWLVVVAITLAVGAASASASPFLGAKWSSRTVTYFDATNRHSAVAEAAARWNASGVNFRLVRTTSRSRVNVVVSASRSIRQCGAGVTDYTSTNGRMRKATVLIFGGRCSRENQVFALTHEFGHVLGLGHETTRCSLMNRSGSDRGGDRCPMPRSSSVWRCRVIEQIDAQRAVRLYGGRAKPVRRNPFCPVPARPAG